VTVRWHVRVTSTRGRYEVRVARITSAGSGYVVLGAYASKHEAEQHRTRVRVNPAAHWREPVRRGPKPSPVTWAVSLRDAARGRVTVTLERREKGRGERKSVIATCESREAAEAYRERVRLNPASHWREPRADHPQAIASKQRAARRLAAERRAAERASRPEPPESIVPAGLPELLPDGRWALACGLHEAARPLRECPACARAHAETVAALSGAMPKRRAA
jgi:hypothetical protein